MRKEGKSDMDITFMGMAFIIDGAMNIIKDSITTICQVENPNWTWIVQPWKFSQQQAVMMNIEKQLEAIDKFNAQLQNAISVASYAISVEQLENALNASNMLEAPKIRCAINNIDVFYAKDSIFL